MPNMIELDRAVTFIQDHPEKHKQKSWTCDTGACLAGWGALLNGYEATITDGWVALEGFGARVNELLRADERWNKGIYDRQRISPIQHPITRPYSDIVDLIVRDLATSHPEFGLCHVGQVAQEIFNITEKDADFLFAEGNTAENIALMVKTLGNGEDLAFHFHLNNEIPLGFVPVSEEN